MNVKSRFASVWTRIFFGGRDRNARLAHPIIVRKYGIPDGLVERVIVARADVCAGQGRVVLDDHVVVVELIEVQFEG